MIELSIFASQWHLKKNSPIAHNQRAKNQALSCARLLETTYKHPKKYPRSVSSAAGESTINFKYENKNNKLEET
jgi:hypothetical protein